MAGNKKSGRKSGIYMLTTNDEIQSLLTIGTKHELEAYSGVRAQYLVMASKKGTYVIAPNGETYRVFKYTEEDDTQ